jgi:hypothetical protein
MLSPRTRILGKYIRIHDIRVYTCTQTSILTELDAQRFTCRHIHAKIFKKTLIAQACTLTKAVYT